MNLVGIVYSEMNPNVEAQIVRDFILLSGEFSDLAYYDPGGEVDPRLMDELGIKKETGTPILNIVYKTGDEWPEVDSRATKVERDLKPEVKGPLMHLTPSVGYYLKPQGRTGANLTERYLNRSYPRGRGVVNPLMLLLWG